MKFFRSKKARRAAKVEAAYKQAVSYMRTMQARYDAALNSPDNRKHWLNVDDLSADAACNSTVRQTLRNRSRYEIGNNSIANGMIKTLANDCVGTGPRLQLLTENESLNRRVESAFSTWTEAIFLPEKLRTMRMAKASDGETFGLLTNNPKLDTPVKLDMVPIEADYVTAPMHNLLGQSNHVDGIYLDNYGNPYAYSVLKHHPGDWYTGCDEAEMYPAENVIHWFNADRPGQHRGIPEITPALTLFAQLRRYTMAVLSAAETAAAFAVIMKTTLLPDDEAAADMSDVSEIDIVRNMITFAPEGWEPQQMKAEQPTTTYAEFKREILNEIARCLNMPFNIAACNSSDYNYASGRLDHQTYHKSTRVDQSHLSRRVLDPILNAWTKEAMLLTQFAELRHLKNIPHQWFFDGYEHVDPVKEANAQKIRLENGTTNCAIECAREGKDWEVVLTQQIKEKLYAERKEQELRKELGMEPKAPESEQPEPEESNEVTKDAA